MNSRFNKGKLQYLILYEGFPLEKAEWKNESVDTVNESFEAKARQFHIDFDKKPGHAEDKNREKYKDGLFSPQPSAVKSPMNADASSPAIGRLFEDVQRENDEAPAVGHLVHPFNAAQAIIDGPVDAPVHAANYRFGSLAEILQDDQGAIYEAPAQRAALGNVENLDKIDPRLRQKRTRSGNLIGDENKDAADPDADVENADIEERKTPEPVTQAPASKRRRITKENYKAGPHGKATRGMVANHGLKVDEVKGVKEDQLKDEARRKRRNAGKSLIVVL